MTNLSEVNRKIKFYIEPEIFMEKLKKYFTKDDGFNNVYRVENLSREGLDFKYLRSIPWIFDENSFDDHLVLIEISKNFNDYNIISNLYEVASLKQNRSLFGGIETNIDYGLLPDGDVLFSVTQTIGCINNRCMVENHAWLSENYKDAFKKPLEEILKIARSAL